MRSVVASSRQTMTDRPVQERPQAGVEAMMRRVDAQACLFAERVVRRRLMEIELDARAGPAKSINVWRNHSIEPILSAAQPYLAFGRWHADFRLSDYDDSLMFTARAPADLELIWLDSERYLRTMSPPQWLAWLGERLHALRQVSDAPIIVATWLAGQGDAREMAEIVRRTPGVHFADLGAYCTERNVALIDRRTAAMAGTPIGNAAQLEIARKLACHWLPATVLPNIKAVALDLDNTLHSGVLGEDGTDGIVLSEGHRHFQQYLRSLRERGIFLALVSRNEPADVEALFAGRPDYPLRWSDFSAAEVSWDDKAASVRRVARTLRIGLDAVLFIDDNPGELASVALSLPEVRSVHATPDASATQRAVHHFPGLWRWQTNADDRKRVEDLKASAQRDAILTDSPDPATYFRTLRIALHYRTDAPEQLERLADLCRKTNQFNLALRRFNEAELAQRMQSPTAAVVGVQLKDRLADSGVIAVVVAERDGCRLTVSEICISCRALGRHLEDTLLLEAIRSMPVYEACSEVAFTVAHAPRNQPALEWLRRILGTARAPDEGVHVVSTEALRRFEAAEGIELVKE